MEGVAGAHEAHGHSARLVVASGDDERLVGMLLHERFRDARRIVELKRLAQVGCGVVSVAGVVELAALHEEEEPGVAVQKLDALRGELGERWLRAVGVDRVLQLAVVAAVEAALAGLEGAEGGSVGGHNEAGLLGELEEVALVLGVLHVVLLAVEAAASDVLVGRVDDVESDLVE